MPIYAPPIESFSKKTNLTPLQRMFDEQITRLFPGGHIRDFGVVGVVPVPLSFVAPEDLTNVTDMSISGTVLATNRHPIDMTAWLTVSPIPSARWSMKKLPRQRARWHAELCRMWTVDGAVFAGRRKGDGSPTWDLAKNPLQDPPRLSQMSLMPGETFSSPFYGHLRLSTHDKSDVMELSVGDRSVLFLRTEDLGLVELPAADSFITIGAPLLCNKTGNAIPYGKVRYRSSATFPTRSRRDHLSATRQKMLVLAAVDFFAALQDGSRCSKWPALLRDYTDVRAAVDSLNAALSRQCRFSETAVAWAKSQVDRYDVLSHSNGVDIVAPFDSDYVCSCGGVDEDHAWHIVAGSDDETVPPLRLSLPAAANVSIQRRFLRKAERLASVPVKWLRSAMRGTDIADRDAAMLLLILNQLGRTSCLPEGVLSDIVPGGRRMVSVPYGPGSIERLAVQVYDWPVWSEFRHEANSIHWDFSPSDARFLSR